MVKARRVIEDPDLKLVAPAPKPEVHSPEPVGAYSHTPLLLEVLPGDLLDNPWQPRLGLDPARVEELAASILQVGLLFRPLARPASPDKSRGVGTSPGQGKYELAHGHYRRAALALLIERGQRQTIPIEVRDLSDEQICMIAFTENRQRRNVSPIEELRGYRKALEHIHGLTIERIAQQVGVDRSTLSNGLRVLRLPSVVLDRVDSGELSVHGAREFLCLVGQEHAHLDVMGWAIGEISGTSAGVAPDWRGSNIRRLIMERVIASNVQQWRRLGEGGKNVQSYTGEWNSDYGTSHRAGPRFDVEAFTSAHAEHVHLIPWGQGSLAWTCDTKSWEVYQRAAPKPAASGSAVGGTVDMAQSPGGRDKQEQGELLAKALAQDPIGKTVLARVAPETLQAQAPKGKKQVAALAALPEDALKELGTRGKFLGDLGRVKGFCMALEPCNATRNVPAYFNAAPCRDTCIEGYSYGRDYAGRLVACCTNERCYQGKHQVFQVEAQRQFEKDMARRDAEDLVIAQEVTAGIADGITAKRVVWALLSGASFTNYVGPPGSGFKWNPATLVRVMSLLGLKQLNEWEMFDCKQAGRAPALDKDEVAREVAGLLVAYRLRSAQVDK